MEKQESQESLVHTFGTRLTGKGRLAKIEGSKKTRRPNMRGFDSVKEATALSLQDLTMVMNDGTIWRLYICRVVISLNNMRTHKNNKWELNTIIVALVFKKYFPSFMKEKTMKKRWTPPLLSSCEIDQ